MLVIEGHQRHPNRLPSIRTVQHNQSYSICSWQGVLELFRMVLVLSTEYAPRLNDCGVLRHAVPLLRRYKTPLAFLSAFQSSAEQQETIASSSWTSHHKSAEVLHQTMLSHRLLKESWSANERRWRVKSVGSERGVVIPHSPPVVAARNASQSAFTRQRSKQGNGATGQPT